MMSTERNQYECRRCGKPIYWHKSQAGKNYPCDSATDRRAFHKCEQSPAHQPTTSPKPITPDYFEATLEQRVDALEKQVAQLTRTLREVKARQPIGDSEVPF